MHDRMYVRSRYNELGDLAIFTKLQNGRRVNDRRTRKKVSMEIMLKKIEGYVFNISLYHVRLKAFITNLEVVITISTDSLPTTYRQITNGRPTVGRQIVTTVEKSVGRQTVDSWPSVGQLSAVCRATVGQQSVEVSSSSLLPKQLCCSIQHFAGNLLTLHCDWTLMLVSLSNML